MNKALTLADVILTLDDVVAGVACFGAPLQDGHGIAEVSPGVLADGSQLEWPVAEMLARQARRVREYARFVLMPCDDREPIEDPAARADGYRAEARRVLARGPSMIGHRVATDADRAWHHDALARLGARFKTEILRRLDAAADVDLADAVAADDLADVDHAQAQERGHLAEEIERLQQRKAKLDAQRVAAWAAADRLCVRQALMPGTAKSWSRVGQAARRLGLLSFPGESKLEWVERLAAKLDGDAA